MTCNLNLFQLAVTRDLDIAITEGLAIRQHQFRDGNSANTVDVGRRPEGGRNMLIVHRRVPSSDVLQLDGTAKRLLRGKLICPVGRQPFWGELDGTPQEAYAVLLAPKGAASLDDDKAVVMQGETDTLDVFLVKFEEGITGSNTICVTAQDGPCRRHFITFDGDELRVEEVVS